MFFVSTVLRHCKSKLFWVFNVAICLFSNRVKPYFNVFFATIFINDHEIAFFFIFIYDLNLFHKYLLFVIRQRSCNLIMICPIYVQCKERWHSKVSVLLSLGPRGWLLTDLSIARLNSVVGHNFMISDCLTVDSLNKTA